MELKRILHFAKMSPIGVLRYSGSYLIRPESTADHIVSCVTLAAMMIRDLEDLGIKINKQKFIYKIAIHDLPESVTSDVIRPLKYHHKALTEEFRIAEEDMIRKAGFPEDLIQDCNNAKDESLEGCLMRIVDILQVVTKLYEEVALLGNKTVLGLYSDAMYTFSSIIKQVGENENINPTVLNYFQSIFKTFKENGKFS